MTNQVNQLYEGYTQEALIMAQGDVQKADYLLHCSWYEYCYRKDNYRKYVEWHNKQVKEAMKK